MKRLIVTVAGAALTAMTLLPAPLRNAFAALADNTLLPQRAQATTQAVLRIIEWHHHREE